MMKWKKSAVIGCSLLLGSALISVSWGQAKAPAKPSSGTALIEGSVMDAQTKQLLIGTVISAKSESGTMRAQQVVTTNGSYQLILDPRQPYQISYTATGYEPHSERLTFTSSTVDYMKRMPTQLYRLGTKPASTSAAAPPAVASSAPVPPAPAPTNAQTPTHQNATSVASAPPVSAPSPGTRVAPPKTLDAKVVYTPPLVVAPTGKTTQLRAIQFVQSKAELLPDAQPALEQLLAYLTSNPTAEIELRGHTDNQGDFDENVRLSKQRVDLVKDLLVKNGVAPGRIKTRGFGPTQPIASNNSESTRQLNRRVEMVVLKQ